jgi:flagellar motor component MotA
MKKFYPVSVVLFLGITVLAIAVSGFRVGYYFHVPALVVVVALPAAMLFATHSPGEIRAAFRAAYRGEDPSELRQSVSFFGALGRYLLWSGLIATLIGVVALLGTLGDSAHVGSGAALALITLLYAIVVNMVVALPFRHAAEKRLARFS